MSKRHTGAGTRYFGRQLGDPEGRSGQVEMLGFRFQD